MIETDRFDKIEIQSREALWSWLDANHARGASVWLITWKAAHPTRYVSRDEVLDALVAHGWIDGIRRKLDDARTMQMISPRQQQIWAASYQKRAARLIEKGLMRSPGLAVINEAKASGLWNARADIDALSLPDDLGAALGSGRDWFDTSAPSYRRNVLRWISTAKKPQTRAKRVGIVAEHAKQGLKVPNY